jgi:SAM-dependent methyltransferase
MATAEAAAPGASDLVGIAAGFQVARALHAAARLRVADLLAGGPRDATRLAADTGMHPDALVRLMRLLVCAGVFSQDDRGAFGLTPLSMHLRSRIRGSLRDFILFHLGPEAYRAWQELDYSLETGHTGFDRAFGMGVWDYRALHQEYAGLFDRAMSDVTRAHIEAILAAYRFDAFGSIVDVGGGTGQLLGRVVAATPGVKGVLFDLPHVAERARGYIASLGLDGRCEVVAGDVFAGLPAGADAYVLSRVIHDWDDAQTLRILRNCRRAMQPHGRVLVMERILPEKVEPLPALRSLLVSDLTMMVMNGGRERTEAQYRDLLSKSGLALAKTIATASGISVLEASAVGVPPTDVESAEQEPEAGRRASSRR